MPELDEEYKEQFMECVTASAEELLDHMCNIVAEGYSLDDHVDRELFDAVDFDASECFNAFVSVDEDVNDLRERLYAVGAGADLHVGNIAYWNGSLVCIDFGSHSST